MLIGSVVTGCTGGGVGVGDGGGCAFAVEFLLCGESGTLVAGGDVTAGPYSTEEVVPEGEERLGKVRLSVEVSEGERLRTRDVWLTLIPQL